MGHWRHSDRLATTAGLGARLPIGCARPTSAFGIRSSAAEHPHRALSRHYGTEDAGAVYLSGNESCDPAKCSSLETLDLTVLLDQPSPRLSAYARETVIAEKFQAMVMLAQINGRLKDYYHIWVLPRGYKYDPKRLARAIAATFEPRTTDIPAKRPDGLLPAFAADTAKQHGGGPFSTTAVKPGDLARVIEDLAAFLMPAAEAARALGNDPFNRNAKGLDVVTDPAKRRASWVSSKACGSKADLMDKDSKRRTARL